MWRHTKGEFKVCNYTLQLIDKFVFEYIPVIFWTEDTIGINISLKIIVGVKQL